jgi:hypothetical protein
MSANVDVVMATDEAGLELKPFSMAYHYIAQHRDRSITCQPRIQVIHFVYHSRVASPACRQFACKNQGTKGDPPRSFLALGLLKMGCVYTTPLRNPLWSPEEDIFIACWPHGLQQKFQAAAQHENFLHRTFTLG